MPKVGDKVRIIGGDLYLGKWLLAGTCGKIVGVIGPHLSSFQVEIDGQVYNLAQSEFEVIPWPDQTIVIEDDGYLD